MLTISEDDAVNLIDVVSAAVAVAKFVTDELKPAPIVMLADVVALEAIVAAKEIFAVNTPDTLETSVSEPLSLIAVVTLDVEMDVALTLAVSGIPVLSVAITTLTTSLIEDASLIAVVRLAVAVVTLVAVAPSLICADSAVVTDEIAEPVALKIMPLVKVEVTDDTTLADAVNLA